MPLKSSLNNDAGLKISHYNSSDGVYPILPLLSEEFPNWTIDKIKNYVKLVVTKKNEIAGMLVAKNEALYNVGLLIYTFQSVGTKYLNNHEEHSNSKEEFTNGIVVENIIAIKRAVKNLVQTNFYERPFQPELGCGVRELLFEQFTPMTKVFLQRKIEEVLVNYEQRIKLQNVTVDDDQDGNRLVVDIYFYVIGVPGPQQVQTFLQRVR